MNRQVLTSDAQREVSRVREMVLGPAKPFASNSKACPKCNNDTAPDGSDVWAVRFCPGKIATLSPQIEQPCQLAGEHLHRLCQSCGYEFRTECADVPVSIT